MQNHKVQVVGGKQNRRPCQALATGLGKSQGPNCGLENSPKTAQNGCMGCAREGPGPGALEAGRHPRGFPKTMGSTVTNHRRKPSHLDLFHVIADALATFSFVATAYLVVRQTIASCGTEKISSCHRLPLWRFSVPQSHGLSATETLAPCHRDIVFAPQRYCLLCHTYVVSVPQ